MVVETQHADATDPTMSRPRGPHHPAHWTPVPSASLLQLHPCLLRHSCPVGYCHCHILPSPIEARVSVCQRAVICHCAVDGPSVWPHNARFSLGVDKRYQGEYDTSSDHSYLNQAYIPSRKRLCDEQVVHVSQGEEGQAEEEERPTLLAVSKVVVPQYQTWQGCQNHQAEQEVESSKVQQDRKENERGDDGQVHFTGSAPQPRHTKPVCQNFSHLRYGFRFLRLPLQKPDKV